MSVELPYIATRAKLNVETKTCCKKSFSLELGNFDISSCKANSAT